MNTKKIAVTGARGLLGSKLVDLGCKAVDADITDYRVLRTEIDQLNPEVIIHCAAKAEPDWVEQNQRAGYIVNVYGSWNLQKCVWKKKIVFISSALVFAGDHMGYLYTEKDFPSPKNCYGHTKKMGEALFSSSPQNLIIRTVNLYGKHPKKVNFITEAIKQLSAGKQIEAALDWRATPILADDLAKAILQLIEADATGTIHLSGPDIWSRYDMGLAIAEAVKADKGLVKPVLGRDLKRPARRGNNYSLNSALAQEILNGVITFTPFRVWLENNIK